MKPDTPIDFAIFQLTPTRTRCELLVVCGAESERLAMGLLKPYLEHLKAAEEQVTKGGYSIKLEPPPEYINGIKMEVPWFTKGLMERFVRFVSTPELLERVSIVELELSQIEEAINLQTNDCSAGDMPGFKGSPTTPPSGTKTSLPLSFDKPGMTPSPKSRRESLEGGETPEAPETSKRQLLRAMDARRLALQKEQGMAFARAGAAGFDMQYLAHLSVFADCFGATRLGDACAKFMALCNKRKEAILWMEEMELATAEAAVFAPTPPHVISKDQYMDMWKDAQSGEADILHVEEVGSNVSHSSPIGEDTAGFGLPRSDVQYSRRSIPFDLHTGLAAGMSPNWTGETNGEYLSRGQDRFNYPGYDDAYDQAMAERGYSEDGTFPVNGGRSRWRRDAGDYHPDYHMFHSPQAVQVNDGVGYIDSNRTQPQWSPSQGQGSDHHWHSTPGYTNNGPGYVHPGELNVHPNMECEYGHIISQGERKQNMMAGIRTSGDALPSASAMEGMVSDHGSLSGTEPDGPFPSHSKHLAKHSTSPNMCSSSPLRRVQVGRSGMRQSGVVVIRNINYFTNPSENAEKSTVKDYSEASESLDETDSAVGDEDDGPKLRGRGNLSVKDAISLFEVKRRGSLDSTKTRVSKQGSYYRNSTDNVGSEKSVLRRWSSTAAELASEPCTTSEKSDQLNGSDNSSGTDMEAEARMSVQTSKNSGSSAPLEEVFILPERHANCLVQTCCSGADSNFVQPLGTHPDDMFMIPKRSGQTSGTDKLLEVNQDHEMVLIDKSELTDESFIMPARVQAQELSALGWRSELHLDSEITSNQGNTMQSEQMTPAPEELFMMSDSQGGRKSMGWSSVVNHNVECLAGDVAFQKSEVAANANGNVPSSKDPKGDKKLKDQAGSRKVEKRKQELLARHARHSDKYAPSADAVLRAEKLRAFKADLARSKKEKEEEERKRLEALRAMRRERIAARSSSAPAARTSRASLCQLSSPKSSAVARLSPQKSTTRLLRGSVSNLAPAALPKSSQIFQRRASTVPSTASNPLSKSVPSFAAFRKENTKPSAVRSSSAFDRGSLMKNNSVPARRASTAPLEANRGQPSSSRSSSTLANHADKKRWSSFGTRKSVSGFKTELSQEVQNSVRGKVSKAVGVEQKELATKMTKRVSATPTAALNTKPFLRKGKGTTQGAMPAARKLKAVSAADSVKVPNRTPPVPLRSPVQDFSVEALPSFLDLNPTPEASHDLVTEDTTERAGVEPVFVPTHASSDVMQAPPCMPIEVGSVDLVPDTDINVGSPYAVSPESVEAPIEDYVAPCVPETLESHVNGQTLSPEFVVAGDEVLSSFTPTAEEQSPAHSQTHGSALTSSSPLASIAPPAMMSSSPISTSTQAQSAPAEVCSVPLAMVTDTSPKYNNPIPIVSSSVDALQSLPVPQASLSPEEVGNTSSSGHLQKISGSSEKLVLMHDKGMKESPRGLRKLLKFRRKSRDSSSHANDWRSASATSQGDEDIEATSEAGFLEAVVRMDKGRRFGSKSSRRASLPSNMSIDIDNESSSGSTMRNSVSTPPSDSKMLDHKSSGGSSGKASRSFFAAFRSKSNEPKS